MTSKNIGIVFILAVLFVMGASMNPSHAFAAGGTLTNFSYSAGSYAANATTTYTFSYTTATNVPASSNYVLYVLFPANGPVYYWNASQVTSNVSVTVNGTAKTIDTGSGYLYVAGNPGGTSGGLLGIPLTTTTAGGSNVVVTVQNVHNSSTAGTYTWDPSLSSSFIKTANGGGGTIDGPASIPALVLTTPPDTTPPGIAFTAPAANSVVVGTTTLSASASDNVAVAGVTFYIDGVKQGSEITSAPYNYSWNSTATSSGTHTTFAVARDTSNNYASSSPIAFIVDNSLPTISGIVTSTATTSATFTWATSKPTSSLINFGPTSSFGTSTPLTDTNPLVTSHTVTIPALLGCTVYLYQLQDTDAGGNIATSSTSFILTPGCANTANVLAYTSGSLTSAIGATKTLATGGHTITVVYPAGVTATSTSLGVQIKALDGLGSLGMPSPSLLLVASSTYELKALTDATTTLTSFALPVTITESYATADISGISESSLTMYHYHAGAWIALTGCTQDTVGKTVSCPTSGFSTFALFGTAPVITQGSTSTISGSTSGGGVMYGCKDPSASNYSEFVASKPSLCVYGSAGSSTSAVSPAVPVTPILATSTGSTKQTFTRTLKRGMSGADVTALQKFLIASHAGSAAQSLAKAGTSTYFGALTKAALIEYQTAHGITPASGNLGSITRAYIATTYTL